MSYRALLVGSFFVSASLTGFLADFFNSRAFAGVNVNNGNFYVAYTDLYLPTSGLNIDVTRTYNSRSNYVKGFFGVGWSSEVEGYLNVEKDSVVYFEGGGGNAVRFAPSGKNLWVNGVFGPQSIKKVNDNYVLTNSVGKDLVFNASGKLQKIFDKNKNFIECVYENNRISMLRDNLNNQIRVKWEDHGKFPRVSLLESGNFKARYEYTETGDLAKATGADGETFAYRYDDEHNMTKITYKDGGYKEMAYNKLKDWITKFRDRDKVTTNYDYIADSLDPESKFGTTVTRSSEGSKEKDISKYWYEFRKRKDGSKYNYKAVTWIRGLATETIFTECCGTPQVISQWKAEDAARDNTLKWTVSKADKKSTFFEYFEDGLLKKKTAPDGTVTALTYDPQIKKVSTVSKGGRKVEYHYDKNSNLAWAFDHAEARRLDLTYDVKGHLTIIKEARVVGNKTQNKEIFFRYNAAGKPIEIKQKSLAGEGAIKISYDNNGAVSQILNGQGRSVSSEKEFQTAQGVANTFQDLLEIVQPAGVALTPEG